MLHLIIVADAARARFFAADDTLDAMEEIQDLVHPQSQLKASDVYTDQAGRRGHGSASPHTPMKHAESHAFAREIGDVAHELALNHERVIVVAPPRFLGALRHTLDRSVTDKTVASIDHDFSRLAIEALPEAIRRHLDPTAGMPAPAGRLG